MCCSVLQFDVVCCSVLRCVLRCVLQAIYGQDSLLSATYAPSSSHSLVDNIRFFFVIHWMCMCMYNRGYQGRRGWVFKFRTPTRSESYKWLWKRKVALKEKKSAQIQKYVPTEVSSPHHWHGQVLSPLPPRVSRACVVCLIPPPSGTRARACLSSTCWWPVCVRRPSPPLLRLNLVDSAWSWKVRECSCQPGRPVTLSFLFLVFCRHIECTPITWGTHFFCV